MNFMNFRAKLEGIQNGIMGNYESAHKHISNSLKQIDSSIKSLTKLKEEMQKWDTFMSRAVTKSEGLTIRKLTHGNPEIRDLIKSAEESEKSVRGTDTSSGVGLTTGSGVTEKAVSLFYAIRMRKSPL